MTRTSADLGLDAHVAAENRHDVDAIMATFAPDAVVVFNGARFESPEGIRELHETLGFGDQGTLSEIVIDERTRETTAAGTVVCEGVVRGRYTGPFPGGEPTGEKVALDYCVLYDMSPDGLVTSERVHLDLSSLFGPPR